MSGSVRRQGEQVRWRRPAFMITVTEECSNVLSPFKSKIAAVEVAFIVLHICSKLLAMAHNENGTLASSVHRFRLGSKLLVKYRESICS
jgi:hypothetical protein